MGSCTSEALGGGSHVVYRFLKHQCCMSLSLIFSPVACLMLPVKYKKRQVYSSLDISVTTMRYRRHNNGPQVSAINGADSIPL